MTDGRTRDGVRQDQPGRRGGLRGRLRRRSPPTSRAPRATSPTSCCAATSRRIPEDEPRTYVLLSEWESKEAFLAWENAPVHTEKRNPMTAVLGREGRADHLGRGPHDQGDGLRRPMHARVNETQWNPERVDEGIRLTEETIIPALPGAPRLQGLLPPHRARRRGRDGDHDVGHRGEHGVQRARSPGR